MTLIEIENLSGTELKARREELVTAAATADSGELAARYIQARTDAVLRDEKLSEQGKTITTLQGAFDQLKASAQADQLKLEGMVAELQQSLLTADAKYDALSKQRVDELATATQAYNSLKAEADSETARADRLKAEAERNLAALNAAAASMTTALTAVATALGQQAVEAADQGS